MPRPGPQAIAYLSKADELFYGGKVGSGKSDVGLGLGLTAHRKTLFLRKNASLLEEISTRAKELMVPGDAWRGIGNGGILRTATGRTIQFSGCEHEKDKQKYKGRAHDLKFWDEVVDFPESVYKFVNIWNRSTVCGQRCRIVAASNPPTEAAGEWVIRRWAPWLDPQHPNPARHGELRWFVNTKDGDDLEVESNAKVLVDGEYVEPRSRTFIPGQMLPELIANGYLGLLSEMDPDLRAIYLHGDFTALRRDGADQLIPVAWVKLANARWERRKAAGFPPLTRTGCDVARGGNAKTALAFFHGSDKDRPTIVKTVAKKGDQTPTGGSVLAMIEENGGRNTDCNVDCTGGYGGSVLDVGKERGGWPNLRSLVVSNATTYHDPTIGNLRFLNLRAAIMWRVRNLLNPDGGADDTRLALPPDSELLADLTAAKYSSAEGKLKVESKPEMVERLGRSPDKGDSVGYACWEKKVVLEFA